MPSEPAGHSSRTRHKLASQLTVDAVRQAVGAEQIEYYRRRAPWYDDIYDCAGDYERGPERNAEWRRHMVELADALARAPLRGECVELGAGTGHWTAEVVDRVDRVWALDSSPEMLDIARRRFEGRSDVVFETVDLWRWRPVRRWDCAMAFFFIEHVPDEVLPSLLTTLHAALHPGGCFFLAEAAWSRDEPPIETREIGQRSYRVVERRRTPTELIAAFNAAGFDAEVGSLDEYVHVTAVRRAASNQRVVVSS